MKRIVRLFSILALLVIGFSLATLSVQASDNKSPKYSHCSCLHNATEFKTITAWGASAYITYTSPLLNGGYWSYHRVGVAQASPWKFVEWGWIKTSTGLHGNIAYNAGSGSQSIQLSGVSAATHRYSMQYDPNTSKYWFYLDGANVYNVNANFSSGNYAIAGGEVATGVEGMFGAYLSDLRYIRKNANGTFSSVLWNGHANYVDNSPYYNTNGSDSNSFYDNP